MSPHQAAPDRSERDALRRVAQGVALVAIVVHAGLFAGGVWSFEPLNYDDAQVLALAESSSVRTLFTEPVWYAYKPIYFLSLKIDTLFGSAASGVAHVHNLLLHALTSALLVLVLAGMLRSRWIAGAAGLLFAVHPVHVESVAWIASRKDVLSLVFVLLAHLAYRRARRLQRGRWIAPALLLLGGLTKGTVWMWPGVLAIDEILEGLRARKEGGAFSARRAIVRLLPCFVIAVGGVFLDATMAIRHGPGAVDHGVAIGSLAAAMAGVHLRYLQSLLVPVGLSIDYAVDPAGSWSSLASWAGLALLALAAGLFVLSLRRGFASGVLASGLWLLGLLPVNNLWPQTTILMADRYLYVPAAGLYVLVLGLLARRPRARGPVLAVLVCGLGALGIARTAVFASSERVWADAIEKEPRSALAHFQAGQAAAARGAWTAAEAHAERAIELGPRPEILVKSRLLRTGALLGRLAAREERGQVVRPEDRELLRREAEAALRLALELDAMPAVKQDAREVQAEALVLRGQVLERLRDPASAIDDYARAVRIWPAHSAAHYNLATLLLQAGSAGDLQIAERHLRAALRHHPAFRDASLQLANVLALAGRADEALAELARARRRHGRSPDLLFAEAQVYLAGGRDVTKAEELLTELRRDAPDHPKASRLLSDIHLARARIRLEVGRAEKDRAKLRAALESFDKASQIQSRRWEAEVGSGDALLELGRYREARQRYRRAIDRARGQDWIHRLDARASVLEAAWLERFGEDPEDRHEAARLMAQAVRSKAARIDLGFLALESELPWLRPVATVFDAGSEAGDRAGDVLLAAALAATGDEAGATRRIRSVLTALGPDTEERGVLDAALLLRGMLRDRNGLLDDARRDYDLLADRRPADPLPRLRRLELRLRRARARLSIAQGHADEPEGIRDALDKVDGLVGELRTFADAHPDLLAAGLVAAEAEMQGANPRWIDALRRLNELLERHPRDPSLYRGQAAIYVAQYIATRTREMLTEAMRALRKALLLDPRDPRTFLDQSNVDRIAQNIPLAIRHAEQARQYELVPSGPAARQLADLHLALGRQAYEAGNAARALQAAEAAGRADPGRAGPWILRGDLYLRAQKLDEAFDAYRTAKELEPLNDDGNRALARVQFARAAIFRFRRLGVRDPTHPSKDGDWERIDEETRRERVEAWTKGVEQREEDRRIWGARELRELEAALRLDPQAERVDEIRKRIQGLRQEDPEARRRAYFESVERVKEARSLSEAGRPLEALRELQVAIERFPDLVAAHLLTAATAYEILSAPSGGTPEEQKLEARYVNMAYDSLHATDMLDPDERYYDRHRFRGLLNEWLYRRRGIEEARLASTRAYERFLRLAEAAGRAADDPILGLVRRRLKRLNEIDGED